MVKKELFNTCKLLSSQHHFTDIFYSWILQRTELYIFKLVIPDMPRRVTGS